MEHFYQNIEGWFDFQDVYKRMVDEVGNVLPHSAVFVEVGSWKGRSAAFMAVEIINSEKNIKFFAVDTWKGSEEILHQTDMDIIDGRLYGKFLLNLSSVSDYVNPIRMLSIQASKLFQTESVDFVFIDASHDFEDVRDDLLVWYPKIKPGGYIGGHDYDIAEYPGVKVAVERFCKEEKINNVEIIGNSFLIKKIKGKQ